MSTWDPIKHDIQAQIEYVSVSSKLLIVALIPSQQGRYIGPLRQPTPNFCP